MNYSKSFERDYSFYLRTMDVFTFSGKPLVAINYEKNGVTAKMCVKQYDSFGLLFPCEEPELAAKILNCKASVNLHIKMYAESLARGEIQLIEIIDLFEEYNSPEWVIKSIKKQAAKNGWLENDYEKSQVAIWRTYTKDNA